MKNVLLLIIGLALASCQSNKKSEVISVKETVMEIHDEAMPKMTELMKTRKKLTVLADSLVDIDSVSSLVIQATASEIDLATESMMMWMRNYEPEFEGSEEEILAYLKRQKEEIQKVKDDMELALEKGIHLLNGY